MDNLFLEAFDGFPDKDPGKFSDFINPEINRTEGLRQSIEEISPRDDIVCSAGFQKDWLPKFDLHRPSFSLAFLELFPLVLKTT